MRGQEMLGRDMHRAVLSAASGCTGETASCTGGGLFTWSEALVPLQLVAPDAGVSVRPGLA